MPSSARTEAKIHKIFDFTLVLKGIHAFAEILGGILLHAASAENILRVVRFFVRGEIREDPHDFVATFLLHTAQSFGGSSQSFAALYLVTHGIINALVVVGLWREKLWAYPVSFVVLAAFIVYQLYLLAFAYSLWLTILTLLDIAIIFLVWHEYGVLKKR
jgi:uncharacterized membrane protein